MKKVLFVLSIYLLLPSFKANAADNEAPFVKGSKTIGIGAGFGVAYGYYGRYVALPSFAVTYDQGCFENVGPGTIGIGGILGFKTAYYDRAGGRATWVNYILAARATYHLTLLADRNNKFDPYGGVMAGLRIQTYDDPFYNGGSNPYSYQPVYPIAGLFVGAKYNFSRNVGVFAELGYDISFARIGLCVNFD